MTQNPYPHLGWNPVPGIPEEVQALKGKVEAAAHALQSSHQKIERLLGESSYWEGDAADAFRDALDGDLTTYMKNAARSIEKAAAQLGRWDGYLGSNRDLARKYDDEAREKKHSADVARTHYEQEQNNPDLDLGNKQFPSQAEADAATDRMRAAERRLRDAFDEVSKANAAYKHVIEKAKTLQGEHEREAKNVAEQLDKADDKLAPKEPGWFDKMISGIGDGLKWVGEKLLEHAGTIGAIAGLLALFPTPLAPLFAGIAVVASVASMANNLSSEDFRASLMGEHGGMAMFSAWASVGGDALGMVPGVGALARAGGEVSLIGKAAADGGEAMSVGAKAVSFGKETVSAFNYKALDAATAPDGRLLQYSLNGANVVGNTASSLETAGVLPGDGVGHNTAEVGKAGVAAAGSPGTVADLWKDSTYLMSGLRL
jgi:hypothetical protein